MTYTERTQTNYDTPVYTIKDGFIEEDTLGDYLRENWSDEWTTPDGVRPDLTTRERAAIIYCVGDTQYASMSGATVAAVGNISDAQEAEMSPDQFDAACEAQITSKEVHVWEVYSYRARRVVTLFDSEADADRFILDNWYRGFKSNDFRHSAHGDNTPMPFYSRADAEEEACRISGVTPQQRILEAVGYEVIDRGKNFDLRYALGNRGSKFVPRYSRNPEELWASVPLDADFCFREIIPLMNSKGYDCRIWYDGAGYDVRFENRSEEEESFSSTGDVLSVEGAICEAFINYLEEGK